MSDFRLLPPCLDQLQSIYCKALEELPGGQLGIPALPNGAKSKQKQTSASKVLKRAKQNPPSPSSKQVPCPLRSSHLCSEEFTISGASSVPNIASHLLSHQPLDM